MRTWFFLAILALLVLGFAGCSSSNSATQTNVPRVSTDTAVALPSAREFFPMEPGMTWSYRVTPEIGGPEARRTRSIYWPRRDGTGVIGSVMWGRFSRVRRAAGTPLYLVLRVKGRAATQGPLSYPLGVELEAVKDDLGIYEDASGIFWAGTDSGGKLLVNEVISYGPDAPGAPTASWGMPATNGGYSLRVAFFEDQPGTGISARSARGEKLVIIGFEDDLVHFQRICDPDAQELPGRGMGRDEPGEPLEQRYTEDLWFARGKGLVKLEQRVGGRLALTLNLEGFSRTGGIPSPIKQSF